MKFVQLTSAATEINDQTGIQEVVKNGSIFVSVDHIIDINRLQNGDEVFFDRGSDIVLLNTKDPVSCFENPEEVYNKITIETFEDIVNEEPSRSNGKVAKTPERNSRSKSCNCACKKRKS